MMKETPLFRNGLHRDYLKQLMIQRMTKKHGAARTDLIEHETTQFIKYRLINKDSIKEFESLMDYKLRKQSLE